MKKNREPVVIGCAYLGRARRDAQMVQVIIQFYKSYVY